MYEPNAARRIMAGHLTNLYAGTIDRAGAERYVRKLGEYAAENADVECGLMCKALADELAAGKSPTLVLPGLGLQVAPDPDHEIDYGPADGGVVLEDDAAERRADAEAAAIAAASSAPPEPLQLTETQVAEAGKPAPLPPELEEGGPPA